MQAEPEKRRWARRPRDAFLLFLRAAPWVMFGPITGFMSERAILHFRRRDPVAGALYIVANVTVLLAMPILTARLLARS